MITTRRVWCVIFAVVLRSDLAYSFLWISYLRYSYFLWFWSESEFFWLLWFGRASCAITRRSLSGWLVFLGRSPSPCKSKKEVTISRCSTKAEYWSMTAITHEFEQWLNLLPWAYNITGQWIYIDSLFCILCRFCNISWTRKIQWSELSFLMWCHSTQ